MTSPTSQTTGMTLALNLTSKHVSLVSKLWDAEDPVYAVSQGSFQALDNGHVLMQHGATPKLEEYDDEGALVMRAWFGEDQEIQSYRGYRFEWAGKPRGRPNAAACTQGGKTAVYVSWNGATEVRSWKVYAGKNKGHLKAVKTATKNGFETRISLDGVASGDVVMVEAVGAGAKSEMVTVDTC